MIARIRKVVKRAPPPWIGKWCFVIGGYTQDYGELTGTHRLWMKIRNRLAPLGWQVQLHPWYERWSNVAEAVRISQNSVPPQVAVYGYSYGGGWGFTQLARQLQARGLYVDVACLCDAVYRSPWFPHVLSWRAMIGRPVIEVPTNVRRVRYLRQRTSRPFGHQLRALDEEFTVLEDAGIVQGVAHTGMDDSKQWQAVAMDVVKEIEQGS